MKPFTFKTILPATILALLPFGTQAGAAPFTFSTTAPDQARGGLEDVDFKMRKAERNWWQPRNPARTTGRTPTRHPTRTAIRRPTALTTKVTTCISGEPFSIT